MPKDREEGFRKPSKDKVRKTPRAKKSVARKHAPRAYKKKKASK